MREEELDTETETYEHIPWSQLTLTAESNDRGRWMYAAAALLIVAAIAAVIARLVWQPEVAVATPSTIPTAPAVQAPETVVTTGLLSEADLMAASPPLGIEQRVSAAAERFIRRWLGGTGERWGYVEWAAVESTEDLAEGRFRVRLLMQVLSGSDEGTVRLPVEAVELTMKVAGDEVSVIDLPAPVAVSQLDVDQPVTVADDAPAAVVAGALSAVEPWGEGRVVSSGLVGDRWRIEVAVQSTDGLVRVVAVWLTPDGARTDPG